LNQLVQQIEASKIDLLKAVSDLSDEFGRAANRVLSTAGDVAAQIQLLNERISVPMLSPVAIPTKYGANITLRGREQELTRLATDKDTLIYGQPGSGKTSLLQTFATSTEAQFILSDNGDAVPARILFQRPKIVIVDDAGPRQELIRRLQHARVESGIELRIIAVCWPFENGLKWAIAARDSERKREKVESIESWD
jgi:tRNA U34 5-carboxymethylaminomethyl modifying GTPase MnmE/TrmE